MRFSSRSDLPFPSFEHSPRPVCLRGVWEAVVLGLFQCRDYVIAREPATLDHGKGTPQGLVILWLANMANDGFHSV